VILVYQILDRALALLTSSLELGSNFELAPRLGPSSKKISKRLELIKTDQWIDNNYIITHENFQGHQSKWKDDYLKNDVTIKLGYNDHGYKKITFITNKIMSHFWSQITGYKDSFHGYNKSRL